MSDDNATVFHRYVDRFDSRYSGLPRGDYYVVITAGEIRVGRKADGPFLTAVPVSAVGGAA